MYEVYLNDNLIYSTASGYPKNTGIIAKTLKLEANRAGSFEFALQKTNPYYDSFVRMKSVVSVKDDDVELFRGRVLKQTTSIFGERSIYCEGDLAYLNDTMLPPVKATETCEAFFRRCINNHNSQMNTATDRFKQFTVGVISNTNKNKQVPFEISSYNDTLGTIESELISYYGGFIRTRRVGSTTYIDWLGEYTNETSQTIEFAVNLVDLTEQISANNLFTVLIPVGKDDITIESVNNGSKELVNQQGVNTFGKIYTTQSFNDAETPATLLQYAQEYMANNYYGFPAVYSVKAIDLHILDGSIGKILLGDKVHLLSQPNGLDKTMQVVSMTINIQNPEENTYELGELAQTLGQRFPTKGAGGGGGSDGGGLGSSASSLSGQAADNAAAATRTINTVRYEVNRNADEIVDHAHKISLIATDEELDTFASLDPTDWETIRNSTIFEITPQSGYLVTTMRAQSDTGVLLNKAGIKTQNDGSVKMVAMKEEVDTVNMNEQDLRARVSKAGVDVNADLGQVKAFAYQKRKVIKDGAEVEEDLWDYQDDIKELTDFNNDIISAAGLILDDGSQSGQVKANLVAYRNDLDKTNGALLYAGVFNNIDQAGNITASQMAKKKIVDDYGTALLQAGVFNEIKTDGTIVSNQMAEKKSVTDMGTALKQAGVFNEIAPDGTITSNQVARQSTLTAYGTALKEAGVFNNIAADGTITSNQVARQSFVTAQSNALVEAGVFNRVNPDGSVSSNQVAKRSVVTDIGTALTQAGVFNNIDSEGRPTSALRVVQAGKILAEINASAEGIQINAAKVDLGQYATVKYLTANYMTSDQVNAAVSTVNNNIAKKITTQSFTCGGTARTTSLETSSLNVAGMTFAKHSISVDGTEKAKFLGTADVNFDRAAAKREGAAAVKILADDITKDGADTFSTDKKTIYTHVRATATNDATNINTIEVNATESYNAGNTAGKNAVTVTASWDSRTLSYSNGSYSLSYTATGSNGKSDTKTLVHSATESYNAGNTAGKNAVTVTASWDSRTLSYSNGSYSLSYTATGSNGKSDTKTLVHSATEAYNAGWSGYYNASGWTKPSADNSWAVMIPSSNPGGREKWFSLSEVMPAGEISIRNPAQGYIVADITICGKYYSKTVQISQ